MTSSTHAQSNISSLFSMILLLCIPCFLSANNPIDKDLKTSAIKVNELENIYIQLDKNESLAVVNYAMPIVSTKCKEQGISVIKVAGPNSGEALAVGLQRVRFKVTDACHNTRFVEFAIVVNPYESEIISSSTESTAQANSKSERSFEVNESKNSTENKLSIYPNPASNKVSISFEGFKNPFVEIVIFNSNGAKVLHKPKQKVLNGVIELPIDHLQVGSYFIRATSNQFVKSFKVNVVR